MVPPAGGGISRSIKFFRGNTATGAGPSPAAVSVTPIQQAARCTLVKGFNNLDSRLFTNNDLLATEQVLAQQMARVFAAIAPVLKPGAVVTDGGSTKCDVVALARTAFGARIGQFVPAHPIAGAELNGASAARAELYRGKKLVLAALPETDPAAAARVASAWQACGARVFPMSPEMHDKTFAAVSHLPHVLAFALVDEIARKPHADLLFQYAASGFRDFTRIAGGSPEMWRDISLANRSALLTEIDEYAARLADVRAMIERSDAAALDAVFSNARDARRAWLDSIESGEKPAASAPKAA